MLISTVAPTTATCIRCDKWPLTASSRDTLLAAQIPVADWRTEYNTYRPHSALGMLTPAEFADQ